MDYLMEVQPVLNRRLRDEDGNGNDKTAATIGSGLVFFVDLCSTAQCGAPNVFHIG